MKRLKLDYDELREWVNGENGAREERLERENFLCEMADISHATLKLLKANYSRLRNNNIRAIQNVIKTYPLGTKLPKITDNLDDNPV